MADQKGFEKPNHTQTPNSFFDESLKTITSLPELKVVLAVIRKTHGWQKTRDQISMSQLEKLTGLKHQSVQRGIDLALRDGFIEREPDGQRFIYSLKLVTPRDQSHHVTSNPVLPEPVTRGDRKLVTPRDTQKKGTKEKKENKAHALLLEHHAKRIGKIMDGGAQGKAAKGILVAGFTVAQAVACYDFQVTEHWRHGNVSWLTVAPKLGGWVAHQSGNGQAVMTPEEKAAKQKRIAAKMGYSYDG